MMIDVMTRFARLLTLCATMVLMAAPISAADNLEAQVELLFVQTDENDDNFISQAEFLKLTATQFMIADANQNDSLEKDEVGKLASDTEFSDNDKDRNGALSLSEVIDEKRQDFASADLNKDGKLNLDEVQKAYKK